ncbi:hypothetical protein KKB55_15460, partial [Myxococcota bacterium]|nr:hypothetical protein [Myxococcota bacterium]
MRTSTESTTLYLSALLLAVGCQADPAEAPDAATITITDRGYAPPVDRGLIDAAWPDDAALDAAVDAAPPDAAPPPACADGVDNDGDGRVDHPDDPDCEGPEGTDEAGPPPPQCSDGLDNDGDDRVDLEDPDCLNHLDGLEEGGNPEVACANGIDDDGDGYADFPLDPGCAAAGDNDELDPAVPRACANGADDDEDGLIDYPNDPGCAGRGDADEADPRPLPRCANGIDDDDDALIDFPQDPGCHGAGDWTEGSLCPGSEGIINLNEAGGDYTGALPGDSLHLGSCGGAAGGEAIFLWRVEAPISELAFSTAHPETDKPTVLYVRRACEMAEDLACNRGTSAAPGTHVILNNPAPGLYYVFVDTSSRDLGPGAFRITAGELPAPACRDEEDNDEDGLIDLLDPGCVEPEDPDEADPDPLPECGDGLDNDGDGRVDYPSDPQCAAAGGAQEAVLCDLPLDADPIEIGQAGGQAALRLMGAEGVAQGSCGGEGGAEEVVILTLDHPSDMILDIADPLGEAAPVAVYVRAACEDSASEQFCERAPLRLIGEALSAGRYFFFFDHLSAGPAPANVLVDFNITSLVTECNDEVDNDDDGLIDLYDPGCEGGRDTSERDVGLSFPCADGVDNDGDGLVDYPDDDGCAAAGDDDEAFACLLLTDIPRVEGNGRLDVNVQDNTYGGACDSNNDSPEAVVELRLEVPTAVELETVSGGFDTKLSIRRVCDEDASEFGCNDDGGEGVLSLLSFSRLEAGSYFVFVEAFGSSTGNVTLEVRTTPIPLFECEDGADNDGDGRVDEADPGCRFSYDDDELDPDPLPECGDGVDNDGDGATDWPDDPGCRRAGAGAEDPLCAAHEVTVIPEEGGELSFDLDPDRLSLTTGSCSPGLGPEAAFVIDLTRLSRVHLTLNQPGMMFIRAACDDSASEVTCTTSQDIELDMVPAGRYFLFVKNTWGTPPSRLTVAVTSLETECNDGVDNDADGLVDLLDPGCLQPLSPSEDDPAVRPQCADGLDNDDNGLIDYPDDLGCTSAGDTEEALRCLGREISETVHQESAGFTLNLSGASAYACDFQGSGPERVVAIVLEQPSRLQAETTEGFDTVLHLRGACDDPDTELACNDDGGEGTLSLITINRLEPGIYFLFVDAYSSSASGEVRVEIDIESLGPPPPTACADGVDNDGDGLVDLDDPGCANASDNNEYNAPPPACADGADN